MPSLRAQLPPVNTLVAFEAVARHRSFTRAGEELFISREAVSRQIRILEQHLGVKLFARLYRTVELTAAGESFLPVVQEDLRDIAQSAATLKRFSQPAKVTVVATVAIASFWLTPRLPRFRVAHPDIEIHINVADIPVDMVAENIDIGLRYGGGVWSGLKATRLFDIESFPVCSPGYLRTGPPIHAPADLLRHTLVNLDGMSHALEDWGWWLRGHGVTLPGRFHTLGFDNYANVIQAAVDGQGVALGFSQLVDELLKSKKLVCPLRAPLSKRRAVYLVVPKSLTPSPSAKMFFDWIRHEANLPARR